MAFFQMPQGSGGGFQQLHPENRGFTQLHDSNDPQAQAYARMALARNGIHVPPGADAAAMWRQFSSQRASMRSQAAQQGPDAYEEGVNPNQPLGGAPDAAQPPGFTPEVLAGRLPEGGFRPGVGGLGPDVVDWRAKIQQMAHTLNPANTIQRTVNASSEFHHQLGGPAEQALAMRRIAAVNQAHGSARNLARMLAAHRPSRSFRQTHDPQAY